VVQIRLRRLDDVLEELQLSVSRGSLLWVDVQGHEGQFFMGAEQTLRRGVPVVAEFWPYGINRSGMSPNEYCQIAEDLFEGFFRHRRGQWSFHQSGELRVLFEELSETSSGTDLVFAPRSSN
jgi:hypothetical protein